MKIKETCNFFLVHRICHCRVIALFKIRRHIGLGLSICPSVCPYKVMGTPVAIKFGQLDTQVVIFEYK